MQDDYKSLIEHKRFLDEVEQGIRVANREIIHAHLPSMSRESILKLAVAVGRLRAQYLEEAFKVGDTGEGKIPSADTIDHLKQFRERYEEARHAFEALRDAIEKGYIDVEGVQ